MENSLIYEAIVSLGGGVDMWVDDTYSKISFTDNKPTFTEEEWKAKLIEVQSSHENLKYQRDRQYPELGEQLDILFHDMTAGKGTKDGEWYKAIAKVKADNPKPTE